MSQLSAEFRTVVCLRLEERTVRENSRNSGPRDRTLKARLFRAGRNCACCLHAVRNSRVIERTSKTRQRRDIGLRSHPRRRERRVRAPVLLEVKPGLQLSWAGEGYSGAGIAKH